MYWVEDFSVQTHTVLWGCAATICATSMEMETTARQPPCRLTPGSPSNPHTPGSWAFLTWHSCHNVTLRTDKIQHARNNSIECSWHDMSPGLISAPAVPQGTLSVMFLLVHMEFGISGDPKTFSTDLSQVSFILHLYVWQFEFHFKGWHLPLCNFFWCWACWFKPLEIFVDLRSCQMTF